MEEWKQFELFPNYFVSNLGNVKSVRTGLPVKPYLSTRSGYYYMRFYKRGGGATGTDFLLSRLVAKLWLQNPEAKKEINHKDGNKANNAVDNLEWCDRKENIDHARSNRLLKGNMPLRATKIATSESWDFYSIGNAASFFGFHKQSICRALKRTNNVYAGIRFSYLDYNAVEYDPQFYQRNSQESPASLKGKKMYAEL